MLLRRPTHFETTELFLLVGQFDPQLGEPLLGGFIVFFGEVHFLHHEPIRGATQFVDLDRARVDLHTQAAARLVD